MNKTLLNLFTLVCVLLSGGLAAQATQWEVNLAAINNVNVTLNEDNCEAMLVPSMILSGDYDVDGDGELPPNMAFDIIVEDGNEANGAIIDGCGSWRWTATARETSVTPLPVIGFETDFAEINWDVIDQDGDGTGAVATFEADTVFLTSAGTGGVIEGGNETGGAEIDNIAVAYTFPVGGRLTFDYMWDLESTLLTDILIVDIDGVVVDRIEPAANDGTTTGMATFDEELAAGNRLQIEILGDDFVSNGDTSLVKFFNFEFQQEDVPGELIGFTTAWGMINAEDKTSPELQELPDAPTELFCSEIDGVNLNTLANNVDRCFRVNGQTGTPLSGNFFNTPLGRKLRAGGGIPTFFDACSDVTVCVNDIIADNGACEDLVITRIFTATDGDCPSVSGEANAPTVAQYDIIFTRPSITDVQPVAETVEFDCTQFSTADPNPQPNASDFPFVIRENGTSVFLGTSFCNLGATFSDGPRIVTCANTYKFVRTFTVVDWCETGITRTFNQLVKVGDFTGPELTAPTQDLDFDGVADNGPLFFSTNSTDCTSFFVIPTVVATDDCSENITITATIQPNGDDEATPLGPFTPGTIAQSVPRGIHNLVYNATDDCGNQADPVIVQIRIDDGTAPVAICEDGLNISIGGAGVAVLQAADIDRASYDECGDVTLAIVRVGEDDQPLPGQTYQPSITIDCSELSAMDADGNPIPDLRLSLRVTDAAGNENFCWLDVLVEDKTAPVCVAPGPRTVTCADLDGSFPDDLDASGLDVEEINALLDAQFGVANGLDNCPTVTITQTYVDNRTSCGTGSISRTFTVTDGQGFTSSPGCRQLITILGVHDYTVVFPADVENSDCIEPNYNGVTFEERGCDLITVSPHVDTFTATADECYKLRITYEVLNWCEYNTENDAYFIPRDADNDDNLAEATYLHVLPRNESTLTDDLAILDRDNNPNNGTTIDELDVHDGGRLFGSNTNGYGTDPSRGAFVYQQFIKVYDETAPTLTIETPDEVGMDLDGDCLADVSLGFSITDDCSPDNVNATAQLDAFVDAGADGVYTLADFVADGGNVSNLIVNNGNGRFTLDLTDLPIGRHAVRIVATDGCGNTAINLIVFNITDNKAPTPICINGLTVTLMPDGNGGAMADIWVSDFIASPATDCSGEVEYAIYRASETMADDFTPSLADTGLTLNCNDDATLIVRIYAIDPQGQSDFCETTLLVQQHTDGLCGGVGNVAGSIHTEAGEPVAGVEISITGLTSSMQISDDNGFFAFEDLPAGDDYTLNPYLDRGHINGVSTFDLLRISRHILDLQSLETPYQYIAADANRSGSITVVDLIVIRRLILGLDDDFENNASWRFIDGTYTFADPTNPLAENYPTVANFNNLSGSEIADFMAVKIGDVTGDADPRIASEGFGPQGSNGRNGSSALVTPTHEFTAGSVIDVPVFAGVDNLIGMQTTINLLDGAELVEIVNGQAEAGNFGTRMLAQGLLTFSYEAAGAVINTEDPIFTLRISTTRDAQLSEVLRFNDRFTNSEAYTLEGELHHLELTTSNLSEAPQVAVLYQNVPNPVVDRTKIAFELPVATSVELTVSDLMGRTILTRKLDGAAGFNQFILDRGSLGAAGVFTYTLTADDFSATRQMVIH